MKNFFIEFEFKSNFENYYWFPLIIHAETSEDAQTLAITVQKALEENYTVKRRTDIKPILDNINAEYFTDYVQQRLHGQVGTLNFDVWKFKNIDSVPELNFNEHLQLINSSGKLFPGTVASTISRQQFPVSIYYSNPDLDFKEFLSVKVVAPSTI